MPAGRNFLHISAGLKFIAGNTKSFPKILLIKSAVDACFCKPVKSLCIFSKPDFIAITHILSSPVQENSQNRLQNIRLFSKLSVLGVRVHQYTITCASSFVQEAAVTALRDCADDVEAMRQEYQRRKDYAVKALNEIDGISCNDPQGAFYIFVNVKSLGMSSMEVAEYFLEEAKVAMVPGSAFGSEGEGYLRLSYACSYEDLQEAIRRIKDAVEKLKK